MARKRRAGSSPATGILWNQGIARKCPRSQVQAFPGDWLFLQNASFRSPVRSPDTPPPFLPIPKRTALPIVPQIATPDTTPTPRHHHWPRLAVLTLAWPAQVWCVKDLPQARTDKGHADNRRGLGRIAGGRLLNPTAAQAEKGGASQEEDRTRRLGSKIRIQKEDAHFAIVEASSGDLARVIDGAR